jgi:hypothetical protein
MDWNIRETSLHCSACTREFQEGEEVFCALFDRVTTFERRDYCTACWPPQDASGVYSRWQRLMPHREKPVTKHVNAEVVYDFFRKLEGEMDRLKQCFRYVLGLMLMRKKVLKFKGVERGDGGEGLRLTDPHTGVEYLVPDPILTEAEVTSLTEEIGKILNISFEAGSGPASSPPPSPDTAKPAPEPMASDAAQTATVA